ncbi:MAG: TolC family protein [Eubacteriales bacterium]
MRKVMIALSTLLIICLWGSASWAKEPATPQLKLNEVIDIAIKHSDSVKKSSLEIDKAKEQRENASDQLTFTPVSGGSYDPGVERAWYSLLSADLTWNMSKKSHTTEEDRLVLDVCQKYWNVQKSMNEVRVKEVSCSLSEVALRRVQAMVRLGMTPPELPPGTSPQSAISSAEGDLARAKSDLTKAENKLNSDYEAINQLLGLWPEDRPALVEEVNFEILEIDNLDTEVQRVIETSPKIWQAEEQITLAKYAYELMWASGSYKSYEIRKAEKEQTELDAVSAKDAVRLATRSLYYTAKNLEAGILAAEKSVVGAEEALRVAKLQYELGMITKENLLKSEGSLSQAKQTLMDLTQQHAYMKLAFKKPWAVSSSGGS